MTGTTATTTGLAICLKFTTERCVATNVGSREQPEWPPHPGRIFMAMAAAYFESEGTEEGKAAERGALDWLAELMETSSPEIRATEEFVRSDITCYVPVNDNPKPNKAMLQSAPGLPRSRQPRSFPTVIPDADGDSDSHVRLVWREASVPDERLTALDRVCRNVIRVGHSSSLVMAWATTDVEPAAAREILWTPVATAGQIACRVPTTGELDRLEAACGADRIDRFAALASEIAESTGKAKASAKAEFGAEFGEPFKASLNPPAPLSATISVWQEYRRVTESDEGSVEADYFSRELLILEIVEGPVLNVERALSLTRALRDAAMSNCPDQPPAEWLSGHNADGGPTTAPHAAFLALPFARAKFADGHLLGLAIALPKQVSAEERGRCLGPTLVDLDSGQPRDIKLWGNNLPDVLVRLRTDVSPRQTLDNETWTQPSTTWASVTPVVLDKFPKASRADDRAAWFDEVRGIVELSCERSGLPKPSHIDIDTTSWHTGIPRSEQKTRRLRRGISDARAPLGNGFPQVPQRESRPVKPQVHVWLRFDQPVAGPVLIGAGRFAGYGLCLPVRER